METRRHHLLSTVPGGQEMASMVDRHNRSGPQSPELFCEDWEDTLEYMLWGEVRSLIESLPREMRPKCVARLVDDGTLDEFEL